MKRHARWLVGLVAGLGLANAAMADTDRQDLVRPDGSRKTVIEVLPTTELVGPPDRLPPSSGAPADPGPRVVDIITPSGAAAPSGWNLWAEADLLEWFYRGSSIPPLVTVGSLFDSTPGALGQPATRVVFGNGPTTAEASTGGRARAGGWIPGTPFGWEVGGFYTMPQDKSGSYFSKGFDVLARPFYDTFLVTPSSLLFGATGAFDGTITVHTRTTFWGAEANATAALNADGSLAGFAGYRHLTMTDELTVGGRYFLETGGLAFNGGIGLLAPATGLITDSVQTRNDFDGAQVGVRYHATYGRFGFDVRGSLAVGVGSERITLNGWTNTSDATGTVKNLPGGILVQPSNAGVYGRDLLTVVPEVGVKAWFAVMPGVSLFAGYDFLYWASVVRAGDQLDNGVDTRQMPSSGQYTGLFPGFRPLSPLRDTAFWAHGVSVGVRFEY